jgi:hypothetical protein
MPEFVDLWKGMVAASQPADDAGEQGALPS